MVPTEIYGDEVAGHTQRDIAGLFTPTATALQLHGVLKQTRGKPELTEEARRVIVTTMSLWRHRS